MDHPDTNSTAPLDTNSTPKPSVGSIHKSSQALPPSPARAEESPDHFHGWKTISEQQGFYDEEGFLYPSYNLTSEKLKDRKEDDVMIFNYSLNCADGNSPVERGGPSSRNFSEDDDIFFLVPKDALIGSEQFGQAINPEKEPRLMQSRERLAIIDFPQCYDTRDENLLNSMAKELHLPNPATFGDAHSKRVLTLPGRGRFRTGFSLRVPSKSPSGLAKSGSSEDKITLFVSFPYFGKSSSSIPLSPESESVELLDFKRLGVDIPSRSTPVSERDKDDLPEILVHQARYMIFDNYTIATFRSKEDSDKDQVPLHRFQERIGAFHAVIQMISNRMDSELWTLGKLQASLCQLEEDIDQMISDAEIYEDNQGMKGIPDDEPPQLRLPPGVVLTVEEESQWEAERNRHRQNKIRKRKQKRVRDLLTSLNRLSADLFAAISVAERQIAVLQDLHSIFSTSYRTKNKDHEKRSLLRRNPVYKNITPIPILLENSEQIWPNTLDTIEEVVGERKYFITKIEALVENMEIRRKIFSGFSKSDQANSGEAAQEATNAMKSIQYTIEKALVEQEQRAQMLDNFTLVTTAFLLLGFCTSYYGMQTVKEFGGSAATLSLRQFWLKSSVLFILVLPVASLIILWKRPYSLKLRSSLWARLGREGRRFRGEAGDLEKVSHTRNSQERIPNGSPNPLGPPYSPGGSRVTTARRASTAPPQTSTDPNLSSESASTNPGPPRAQPPWSP